MTEKEFYRHVNRINGCWEWNRRRDKEGYGRVPHNGNSSYLAHRLSYEFSSRRAIPHSMCVLHRCDNPSCVRPAHLWLGTRLENNRDMTSKGRNWQSHITHCRRGHDYSGANVGVRSGGKRYCKECHKIVSLRWYNSVGKEKRRARQL